MGNYNTVVASSIIPLSLSFPPFLYADPGSYFAWIIAVVVSVSIILIVITVVVVVVVVMHAKCLAISTSTTPEESSAGSDCPPKMTLMKQVPQVTTKVQVVTPTSLDTIMNWDNGDRCNVV